MLFGPLLLSLGTATTCCVLSDPVVLARVHSPSKAIQLFNFAPARKKPFVPKSATELAAEGQAQENQRAGTRSQVEVGARPAVDGAAFAFLCVAGLLIGRRGACVVQPLHLLAAFLQGTSCCSTSPRTASRSPT